MKLADASPLNCAITLSPQASLIKEDIFFKMIILPFVSFNTRKFQKNVGNGGRVVKSSTDLSLITAILK